MPLLHLDQLSLSYGTHVLLDDVELILRSGERVGLLGRNGAGKSTLLKVLDGAIAPDSGKRWIRDGVKCAYLDQSLPDADSASVYDMVASGLAEVGGLLARYHHCIVENDMVGLAAVQQELESRDGWSLQQRVDTVISQLQLPGDAIMGELSGGWRRRVALGRALVSEPEILLLDEPTNHLDIPAIEWLEQQLKSFAGALVFVTHDRSFLNSLANRVVELDRGRLLEWSGSYSGFLNHKEQQLAAQERSNVLFDKRLAEEEKWIRQGIKARRTRNEGRVRALKAMRVERSQRREKTGRADFAIEGGERSGKRVVELDKASHRYGDNVILQNFSTLVSRGDRVGIVGVNGVGKSTLVKILLGKLMPDSGQVKLGSKLDVAYFDQLRETMDPNKDLIDNVCGGQDFIEINGKRRHAISYLSDFLFGPDRVRTPFKALSGGEQNRAILARLFSKPANFLVLDEPTNDLDVETLELLEELLLEFKGTMLLVSHDRAFMDNVVTSIIVMAGNGVVEEHVGGYTDWVAKGNRLQPLGEETGRSKENGSTVEVSGKDKPEPSRKTKLSYKLQRELDSLPATIESLEQQLETVQAQVSASEFFQQDFSVTDPILKELEMLQERLEQAYARWEELDN